MGLIVTVWLQATGPAPHAAPTILPDAQSASAAQSPGAPVSARLLPCAIYSRLFFLVRLVLGLLPSAQQLPFCHLLPGHASCCTLHLCSCSPVHTAQCMCSTVGELLRIHLPLVGPFIDGLLTVRRPGHIPGAEGGGRQMGQPEARDGDWACPECGVNNFAYRGECFRCQAER